MFNLTENSIVLPGRIVSFDAVLQLAEIKISMDRIWSSSSQNPATTPRENIFGVPTRYPFGGDYSVTLPVAAGDTCLLVFSQMGYDHWLYEDKDLGGMLEDNPVPHLRRNFNEEDGFCIPFRNRVNALQNYSATDLEIRNSDSTQFIALRADGTIDIETTGNVNVKAPTVAIDGNLTVSGNITATGEVTGNGINLSTHVHGGVQTGGGVTSTPQ